MIQSFFVWKHGRSKDQMRGHACLVARLPLDVVGVIVRMTAVARIQRAWRAHRAIHRRAYLRCPEWPRLRQALELSDPGLSQALEVYSGIRREWTSEPMSWITMLLSAASEADLAIIRVECSQGLWGSLS